MDKRILFDIHMLYNMGMSKRQIARMLGLSRPTVQRYLKNPDLTKPRPAAKTSILAPFYDQIKELLEKWPDASAVVIKQRIQARGYLGGITILRDYLQAIRDKQKCLFR
jgi:transposase